MINLPSTIISQYANSPVLQALLNSWNTAVDPSLIPVTSTGATFSGSITGNILAVSSVSSGSLVVGQQINGQGIPAFGTIITAPNSAVSSNAVFSSIPAAGVALAGVLPSVGDGVTGTFLYTGGGITKTDWQGTQLLYATARTNFCSKSQKLDDAAWANLIAGTGTNPVVTANYGLGPEGFMTAERIQFDQGGGTTVGNYSLRRTPALSGLTVGQPVVVSFWAKSNTSAQTLYVGGSTISSANATVSLTTTLQRFAVPMGTAGSASGNMIFGLRGTFSTGSTADITITDFQIEQNAGAVATSFILADAAAVTVTDYVLSPVTAYFLNQTFAAPIPTGTMTGLMTGSPFNAWYSSVWNIYTAQGYGLDVWGRILGVNRNLNMPNTSLQPYFGFIEANSWLPWNDAPFLGGTITGNNFAQPDPAFLQMLLAKALANISGCSAFAMNVMLQLLFAGRGRAYVIDSGNMTAFIVCEFTITPVDIAVVTQAKVIAHPAGVQMYLANLTDLTTLFGFSNTGLQPFGSGTLNNNSFMAITT